MFYTFSRSSHWLEWDQKAHGNWQPHESICLTERWTGRRETDGLQMCREMMRNVDICGWWGNTWAQNTKSGTESIFLYGSYPFHAISYHFLQESRNNSLSLEGLDFFSQVRPSCYTSHGSLYLQTAWVTVPTQKLRSVWPSLKSFRPPPTTKVTLGSHCGLMPEYPGDLHHQTGEFAEWRYHSVW